MLVGCTGEDVILLISKDNRLSHLHQQPALTGETVPSTSECLALGDRCKLQPNTLYSGIIQRDGLQDWMRLAPGLQTIWMVEMDWQHRIKAAVWNACFPA
jgi:hypothetical protein